MNTENIDKRPKCGWPVPGGPDPAKNTGTVPCGSEERVFNVKGRGRWGYPKETPVCEKHLPEAWKKWNVDSAEPVCPKTQAGSLCHQEVVKELCHRVIRWIDDLNR